MSPGVLCLELVLLTENVTGENDEVISFNNIDGEEYEEVGDDNIWK